jgi:hypothetical protein
MSASATRYAEARIVRRTAHIVQAPLTLVLVPLRLFSPDYACPAPLTLFLAPLTVVQTPIPSADITSPTVWNDPVTRIVPAPSCTF